MAASSNWPAAAAAATRKNSGRAASGASGGGRERTATSPSDMSSGEFASAAAAEDEEDDDEVEVEVEEDPPSRDPPRRACDASGENSPSSSTRASRVTPAAAPVARDPRDSRRVRTMASKHLWNARSTATIIPTRPAPSGAGVSVSRLTRIPRSDPRVGTSPGRSDQPPSATADHGSRLVAAAWLSRCAIVGGALSGFDGPWPWPWPWQWPW